MHPQGTTWIKNARRKLVAAVVGAAMLAGGIAAVDSDQTVANGALVEVVETVETVEIGALDAEPKIVPADDIADEKDSDVEAVRRRRLRGGNSASGITWS